MKLEAVVVTGGHPQGQASRARRWSVDHYDAHIAERYGCIYRAMPIPLAPVEDIQRDSDEFGASVRSPQTQRLLQAALDGLITARPIEVRTPLG